MQSVRVQGSRRRTDEARVPGAPAQILSSARMAEAVAADLPESLEPTPIGSLSEVGTALGPATVLLADPAWQDALDPPRLRTLPRWWVVVAPDGPAADAARQAGRLFLRLPDLPGPARRECLRAALLHAQGLVAAEQLRREGELLARDLFELSEVGGALMQPRDLQELMTTILREARRVTSSDAGSLYLVDGEHLRFHWTQNESLPGLDPPDLEIPIDRSSFAGYAAATGETLRIDDAYAVPESLPCRFDRRFDEANGYRTRAVLVVPMLAPSGVTVGVLQLLNPAAGCYATRDEQIARALGGQAAVSIENQRLRDEIEALFEGFIRAAVTALDQRDPGTSGHSERVAELTCALAEHADRCGHGALAEVAFAGSELREIRYAALLHDFGKVFVSEQVLGKDRKLPPEREVALRGRFAHAHEALERRYHAELARYLQECGSAGFEAFEKRLRRGIDEERDRLRHFERAVQRANEPRVLASEVSQELVVIAEHRLVDSDDQPIQLLQPGDLDYLSVPQGSLTSQERRAIESHVTYTHRFLEQIPWTRDLARVDAIASSHHEKLDGSGYPLGLGAAEIPIQTRMLTIADIFDALTAADRPYKKALPLEKALDILSQEASRGRIDPSLLELFIGSETWTVLA